MTEIQFTYSFTVDDFKTFAKENNKRINFRKTTFILILIILFLMVIIQCLINEYLSACFILVGMVLYVLIHLLNNASKMKKAHKTLQRLNPFMFLLTDESFTVTTAEAKSHIEYHELYKIIESKSCFFLYVNKYRPLFILKKCLTEEQSTALQKRLKEILGMNYVKKF